MNYEFSDKEFNLFVEIHTLISEFVKENNLEKTKNLLTSISESVALPTAAAR